LGDIAFGGWEVVLHYEGQGAKSYLTFGILCLFRETLDLRLALRITKNSLVVG